MLKYILLLGRVRGKETAYKLFSALFEANSEEELKDK
jgi:hypothetical protein